LKSKCWCESENESGKAREREVGGGVFGGRREETKAEPDFLESCKRSPSSLNPPQPTTPVFSLNPAITRFNPFTKMSDSNEGQPGDVRSPSFYLHHLILDNVS
jgi:hypothetical protein